MDFVLSYTLRCSPEYRYDSSASLPCVSENTERVLVYTPLRIPSSFINPRTLRVPSTLTEYACVLSRAPTLYQAATWNTPSTPVIGSRMLSLSVMSPAKTSTPLDLSAL